MLTLNSILVCDCKTLDHNQASANRHVSLLSSVSRLLKLINCNIDPLNYLNPSIFLSFDITFYIYINYLKAQLCQLFCPFVLRKGMNHSVCCITCCKQIKVLETLLFTFTKKLYNTHYTVQIFEVGNICFQVIDVFVSCSLMLHLFDKNYCNIVRYYYNLK